MPDRDKPDRMMTHAVLDRDELKILELLDQALQSESARNKLAAIVSRVEATLARRPDAPLAWEAVPLECYRTPLPEMIRSSWVFILRASTSTGAEKHPNSHQRMMSYRGEGEFQTRTDGPWRSHRLKSDRAAPVPERWISIPPNVWHQGVVPEKNWVVVSFHTAGENELIEERPDSLDEKVTHQMKYVDLRIG